MLAKAPAGLQGLQVHRATTHLVSDRASFHAHSHPFPPSLSPFPQSKQLIPCITEGCPGFLKLAISMEGPTVGASHKLEQYVIPKALEDKLKEDEARVRQERQARVAAALVRG